MLVDVTKISASLRFSAPRGDGWKIVEIGAGSHRHRGGRLGAGAAETLRRHEQPVTILLEWQWS